MRILAGLDPPRHPVLLLPDVDRARRSLAVCRVDGPPPSLMRFGFGWNGHAATTPPSKIVITLSDTGSGTAAGQPSPLPFVALIALAGVSLGLRRRLAL